MKRITEEEPIEQAFAEVAAYLVEAEDMRLPSIEARVRDVRDVLKKAYDVLERLEVRVTTQKPKK